MAERHMDCILTTSATQDRVSRSLNSLNSLILIENLQHRRLGMRCPGLFGTNKK